MNSLGNGGQNLQKKRVILLLNLQSFKGFPVKPRLDFYRMPPEIKMFLKPVWVGKIHGVEVYATHVVRIWWFSNKFSIFQLKRM